MKLRFFIGFHPDQLLHGLYLIKIAGGFGMITSLCGWYMAIRACCKLNGMPWTLPEFSLQKKQDGAIVDQRVPINNL